MIFTEVEIDMKNRGGRQNCVVSESGFIRSGDVQHNTLNNSVAVCQGREKNKRKR